MVHPPPMATLYYSLASVFTRRKRCLGLASGRTSPPQPPAPGPGPPGAAHSFPLRRASRMPLGCAIRVIRRSKPAQGSPLPSPPVASVGAGWRILPLRLCVPVVSRLYAIPIKRAQPQAACGRTCAGNRLMLPMSNCRSQGHSQEPSESEEQPPLSPPHPSGSAST